VDANYAGVAQKWLLLTSEQARKRELHTLEKNLLKSTETSLKQFQRLCQQRFSCEADALAALAAFAKEQTYVDILAPACETIPVFAGKGRPKKGQEPERHEYRLTGCAMTHLDRVEQARLQSGTFILASNDCSGQLGMAELLDIYKAQQSVERGFRFLKSPEFLTASLFLKKPERIEALLMVMTCSLMIYAALEHRIRSELKAQNQTFPDMKNKPSQSPTARWVFLCFAGIHELQVGDTSPMVLGLKPHQGVILDCLGEQYRQVYS
jgi:transposase